MGYPNHKFKSEHNGAKHGEGHHGRKKEAKRFSNKNRRQKDRRIAQGNFDEEWTDDF